MRFQNNNEIDPKLKAQIDALRRVTVERDPDVVNKTRAEFISKVEYLYVSKPVPQRLTLQNYFQNLIRSGKVRFAMAPTLISMVLALALFLGGSGISVVAAQNSQPDNILYPVKLLSEDIQELFTIRPQEKLNLAIYLSQKRLDEISQVLEKGEIPDETVLSRLQNHLMTAFQLAVETDPNNNEEMLRLQNRLQEQIRIMDQLHIGENPQGETVLMRTRDLLQTQIRLVDNSLKSPELIKIQNQDMDLDQDKVQNQNLDMSQNQNQDITQNQNQDMIQNQNQDMAQNQNQDMIKNQNQDSDQNENSNLQMNNPSGNINMNEYIPTLIPGNGNNGPNPNGGGGGRK
jgi:hypothetical protein